MRIKNVLQYLERAAQCYPDKVAFSGGVAGDEMTFATLWQQAQRVGSALCRAGLRGRRVALLLERSPEAIATMLGAIYAGCLYIPLDAGMPRVRLCDILSRGRATAVICDEVGAKAAAAELPCLPVRELFAAEVDEAALAAVRRAQIDTDPLYMIFTSGSTGTPKGVVACHRSVIDYGEALTAALAIDEGTVFGCQSPLYFDAPLKEILGTLLCGATTVLIPRRLFSFPLLLLNFLEDKHINTICWVSSALSTVAALGALEACPPRGLARVVFGSEVLPRPHYDAWRAAVPGATFYQLYGPTEATGMSCVWRADRELLPDERIPIGEPLDNTRLMLIDEAGGEVRPQAGQASEVGQIHLAGSCLALGYDNDAAATEAAFVQSPLQSDYPEVVYRTGDLARYNARGELEFIGRCDGQIKRMGHRIEPGEIEAAAMASRGVVRAVCLAAGGEPVLFYIGEIEAAALAEELAQRLPRYYLPSRVIRREAFALTDNGKIDRRALRAVLEGESDDAR